MNTWWLWIPVLVVAVWAAHWGAEHLAEPLKKLRKKWGLTGAAGGALVAMATTMPEIGINITSAVRGVVDIGLGAMLGANIVALPLTITVAYAAFRTDSRNQQMEESNGQGRGCVLRVEREAVTVQALPYLGILLLVALVTLPVPWRGLQPVDGWIMLAAYVAYLTQAVIRGREEGERVEWTKREASFAAAGVLVLALGAYFTVLATENIVSGLGISQLVGGLFITGTMSALPEAFSTWSVMRSGQSTAATTTIIGDQATTMTLAFFPLALVTVQLQNLRLYSVSLAALILLAIAYGTLIRWGSPEPGFTRWKVFVLCVLFVGYVVVVFLWVLPAR
jgi:cation:H+ antiporter